MSIRRQPRTINDYEALASLVEGTRDSRIPGMLNAQVGHYATVTLLDGKASQEVVFEPNAPHGDSYVSRVDDSYFEAGIVTVMSRRAIC